MTTNLAVCYVADENFLLGTLISVQSLRRFVPADLARIFVFYVDADLELLERVQRSLARYDATILPLRFNDQIDLASKTWNETHVPNSTLGRFYFEPDLPQTIERILYIDGDTLIVRNPSELIHYVPLEHELAATEDISFFARKDWGRYGEATRGYFAGLGIDGSSGYLNAGVLLARRDAWKRIVADARDFFAANSDRCKYHDQSALNAVVGDRRVRLSPKWNFQTPFCYWNVQEKTQACIFHFTEFPKPWMGNSSPWGFLSERYSAALSEFADLGLPANRLSQTDVENYDRLKVARAKRLATRLPLRLLRRRRDFRQLTSSARI